MKLLLDENLPHALRSQLVGHDCYTTVWMGWSGVQNGELLQKAAADGFDALITNDRGLEYEQNPATLPLAIVVLMAENNKSATIERAVPIILDILKRLQPKTIARIVVT